MDYWQNPELDGRFAVAGYTLNLRGALAFSLVEKWGAVMGKIEREDNAGRAILDVMPPQEVVDRAFTVADLAVSELTKRGWIRAVTTTPEAFGATLGRIESARDEGRYAELRKARETTTDVPDEAPTKT